MPPPSTASRSCRVQDVTKTYTLPDRATVLRHAGGEGRARRRASTCLRGENFGLIGESGCGKSTLSRLLSWIEPPDRGIDRVRGTGHRPRWAGAELKAMRHRFQLLLQDPYNSIPPNQTIGRAIEEPLAHSRKDGREGTARAGARGDVRGRAAVGDYERMLVGLSAGQRQRVNVARALILEPELLILDETLSSLDQVEQGRLLDLFERLQAAHGFTYLFISHDLAMVRRVCSRIAVMYLGKIVELADNRTDLLHARSPLHARPAQRDADAGGAAVHDRRMPARRRAAEPDRPAGRMQLQRALPARDAAARSGSRTS